MTLSFRGWQRPAIVGLSQLYLASFGWLPALSLSWASWNWSSAAIAQPVPPTQQLLEDARERLIDRGELAPIPPAPDGLPSAAPALPIDRSSQEFEVYRLGAGDSIFVNVLRFADLSVQTTLDLQGNVVMPLVGALSLQGLTLPEAREQIRIALDRYIIDPQVDVILIAQRPVQVTILGEVARPGLYPLTAPQLSVALVAAGGATRLADLRQIRVRRTLTDGSIAEREVDLFTPLREALTLPDLALADGDTIILPTLAQETADYDRNLVARSTLAQPEITIKVINYTGARGGTISNLVLPNGSSFTDAIASVAIDLNNADLRNIGLVRFDVTQGRAASQELDGKAALLGDFSQNPILESNDVIVIGRNLVARITYALNTFTQPFRDVLGFLLFFQSLTQSASDLFGPAGNSSDPESNP